MNDTQGCHFLTMPMRRWGRIKCLLLPSDLILRMNLYGIGTFKRLCGLEI